MSIRDETLSGFEAFANAAKSLAVFLWQNVPIRGTSNPACALGVSRYTIWETQDYLGRLEKLHPLGAPPTYLMHSVGEIDHAASAIRQWVIEWIQAEHKCRPPDAALQPNADRLRRLRQATRLLTTRIAALRTRGEVVVELREPGKADDGAGSAPPTAGGSDEKQHERQPTGVSVPPATHSRDFTTVQWYGAPYTFTKTQTACVKVLWEEWERQTPTVSQETILEAAGSAGSNLRDVFKAKKGMHPAWGTMIVEAGKGCFRLQEPEKRRPRGKPEENPT